MVVPLACSKAVPTQGGKHPPRHDTQHLAHANTETTSKACTAWGRTQMEATVFNSQKAETALGSTLKPDSELESELDLFGIVQCKHPHPSYPQTPLLAHGV